MTGAANGRRTYRYQQLCLQVRAEEDTCWLCHRAVDQTLDARDKWSATIDHIVPISRLAEDDPRREDRAYLRLAHRYCNSSRGAKPASVRLASRRW